MMFCLTILTVSLVVLPGCSLSRFTEGRVAGQLLNKVLSSGTQRRSVLDEIERDEPEYLLDSVFKKIETSNQLIRTKIKRLLIS